MKISACMIADTRNSVHEKRLYSITVWLKPTHASQLVAPNHNQAVLFSQSPLYPSNKHKIAHLTASSTPRVLIRARCGNLEGCRNNPRKACDTKGFRRQLTRRSSRNVSWAHRLSTSAGKSQTISRNVRFRVFFWARGWATPNG